MINVWALPVPVSSHGIWLSSSQNQVHPQIATRSTLHNLLYFQSVFEPGTMIMKIYIFGWPISETEDCTHAILTVVPSVSNLSTWDMFFSYLFYEVPAVLCFTGEKSGAKTQRIADPRAKPMDITRRARTGACPTRVCPSRTSPTTTWSRASCLRNRCPQESFP